MKIINSNCNSINNKFEEFKFFLIKHLPDIITLNETKINNFTANNLFNQLNNYNFIHLSTKTLTEYLNKLWK